jgi:hypothetical protein
LSPPGLDDGYSARLVEKTGCEMTATGRHFQFTRWHRRHRRGGTFGRRQPLPDANALVDLELTISDDFKHFNFDPAHLTRREAKQAGRIVNENAFPERFFWRDHGQEIEQIAFVGRAARHERISVRPIGTPDHTFGRCFDDRLGEGDHIQVRQASLDTRFGDRTDFVETTQLHPKAVILQ